MVGFGNCPGQFYIQLFPGGGISLPRHTPAKDARGFWKYDWVANSVLFGLYHLHKPWSILSNIVMDLGATWPARRFRSNWMAIIVHGAESLMVLALVLGVILELVSR